jgi:hypothetical protein
MKLYIGLGYIFIIMILLVGAAACAQTTPTDVVVPTQEPGVDSPPENPEPTPTFTPVVVLVTPTPTPSSRCQDLSGNFEMQILVGPSDAVGLEPHAVGDIPFSVVSASEPYLIEGSNQLDYSDILTEEWGSFTVTFNMQVTVSGECIPGEGVEELHAHLDMSGNQLVVVESEGFKGEYPWSGDHAFDLVFPLQEGASASGEGWAFVLHVGE